jgi:predicted DNA-binding transcriptional regulator AlpA
MTEKRFIPDPEVRKRYGGISEMTLWRWERDPKLRFPAAIRIHNRKYRDESQLIEWERSRAAERVTTHEVA